MARFEFTLEDNLFNLHRELSEGTYRPELYEAFYVKDPKLRHIHKASVRDRVVHQAVYRVLYPTFDKGFIFDSYSSRNFKGTHRGARRLEIFIRKATRNWTRQAWCLKCDVRKFFDSIDHKILSLLISESVSDARTMELIKTILASFDKSPGKGLPLGNVTSQLFANVYMDEFDQFAKHILKARYYARYCDDFVIVEQNIDVLESHLPQIRRFLSEELELELHPNKVSIRKARQGIDFLGYVVLPHRNVLRTKTKRRILKKVNGKNQASYKGMLLHCKGKMIEKEIDGLCDRMLKP
ncbi:MAG: reverse transcriptase/maturase family protein [bacterium]|nr:reverse transcriptase/maturase family protein [bacterium]